MKHNPIVYPDPQGHGWYAWCKPCGWERGPTPQWSMAIHWKHEHAGTPMEVR